MLERVPPIAHNPFQAEDAPVRRKASMSDIIDAFAAVQQAVDTWTRQLSLEDRAKIEKIVTLYEEQQGVNTWQGIWSGVIGVSTGFLQIGAGYMPSLEGISSVVGKGLGKVPETIYENKKVGIQSGLTLEQRVENMVQEMMRSNQAFYSQMFQTLQTIQSTKAQESGR